MRVYGRLGQLKPRKKKNPHMMIGLCGCMMQEPEVVEKLKTSYRYVDIIFGTHNIFKFAELIVTRFESQRMVIDIWKDTDKIVENLPNDRKYSFKSAVHPRCIKICKSFFQKCINHFLCKFNINTASIIRIKKRQSHKSKTKFFFTCKYIFH